MYKRFIRWASDRLIDDGIIAFVCNSAFLDSRQDDGFRKVLADEFNELWVIDLKGNAWTSGERRRREGGNIFDDKIRVGVAVFFLVRKQDGLGFRVHYDVVDDYVRSGDKIGYVSSKNLVESAFTEIFPDANGRWLDKSESDFQELIELANSDTRYQKVTRQENATFKLYSLGVSTNRDQWVYDHEVSSLRNKVRFFGNIYNRALDADEEAFDPRIKWSSTLETRFRHDRAEEKDKRENITYARENIIETLVKPFVKKQHFADFRLNDRLTDNHFTIFGSSLNQINKVICFCVNKKDFYVLATDRLFDLHFTGDTQSLPLQRYTPEGDPVSNITEWGIRQAREHYGDDDISAEDIFSYTYAVLHDPKYREAYAVDLLQEFPRLFLHDDFHEWARLGQELLDLHVGYETTTPWNLNRIEQQKPPGKPRLRADKERGTTTLDNRTTLTGIPDTAWEYRLGSRSALEWVLNQYKERKPTDPTIREHFNTYRFADHKEHVIDLLKRVCTVSVETVRIVNELAELSDIEPTQPQIPEPEVITLTRTGAVT